MHYEEELYRLYKNKIAPELAATLRDCYVRELHSPSNSLRLPLTASAKLAYEKNMAAFVIEGFVKGENKNCLNARQIFTNRELQLSSDKAAVIEYVFDKLKADFIHKLASDELDKIMKGE